MDLDAIVESIMAKPGPVRLVAIDGRGGAGKSTFARALAVAAGGAPVVHTDDYADVFEPEPWWPLLLEQVIEPLVKGESGVAWHRPEAGGEAELVTVEPSPIVIIEGVSSGRREWADRLAFVFWIDTPTDVRRERMLRRDGEEAEKLWDDYETEEDEHFARHRTREHADLIIDGLGELGHG